MTLQPLATPARAPKRKHPEESNFISMHQCFKEKLAPWFFSAAPSAQVSQKTICLLNETSQASAAADADEITGKSNE